MVVYLKCSKYWRDYVHLVTRLQSLRTGDLANNKKKRREKMNRQQERVVIYRVQSIHSLTTHHHTTHSTLPSINRYLPLLCHCAQRKTQISEFQSLRWERSRAPYAQQYATTFQREPRELHDLLQFRLW